MQKALTFKRKATEVEAIQFKGEENLQATMDFFKKHDTTARPSYFVKGHDKKLGVIEFVTSDSNGNTIWEALAPTDWIVVDGLETPFFVIHSTTSFARRYEGI